MVEIERFLQEEKDIQSQQAKKAFEEWKAQKLQDYMIEVETLHLDGEILKQEERGVYTSQTTIIYIFIPLVLCAVLTPSVPGYCSVWCCDKELAPSIVKKIKRPNSAGFVS